MLCAVNHVPVEFPGQTPELFQPFRPQRWAELLKPPSFTWPHTADTLWPRCSCKDISKTSEYCSGKRLASGVSSGAWADGGEHRLLQEQQHGGLVSPLWSCFGFVPLSTQSWLTGRICISLALVMQGACLCEVPWGCEDKGEREAWKQRSSRKEKSQVLERDAFSVLSHRHTNAGGLAEAYFRPQTPPHVPDLLGCVCCWD